MPSTVQVLIQAGGGSGGDSSIQYGGAGGGGGYKYDATHAVVSGSYPVTVGLGGVAQAPLGVNPNSTNGGVSTFHFLTADGGGGGGRGSISPGQAGGSAGGGGGGPGGGFTGGVGISGQGYNGGSGDTNAGGGGGGAGTVGQNATANVAGNGGAGIANPITGSLITRLGGGGGSGANTPSVGVDGGGNPGVAGTANTGGGGGGGYGGTYPEGAPGGDGVVIISFPTDGSTGMYAPACTGGTITTVSGQQIHTFTSSGTFVSAIHVDYVMTADTGYFSLTGQDVGVFPGKGIIAETGYFTLTGQDALFPLALKWNDQLKHGSTFTNQTKNTSSFINQLKHTASWNDQYKAGVVQPIVTYYWVGGAGNWSGNHWALTSGGTPNAAYVPNSLTNVIFDANSTGTVTVDIAAFCADLDFTGFTGTFAGTAALNIYGSLILSSGMTRTFTGAITFRATSQKTITMNGKSLDATGSHQIIFDGIGGEWVLQDDWTESANTGTTGVVIKNGSFNANNHNVTPGCRWSNGSSTDGVRGIKMGSGTWNFNGFHGFTFTILSNFTLDPSTSTISFAPIGQSGTQTFIGGGFTYYNLQDVGTGTYLMAISGSNTFNKITARPGGGIKFTGGTTTTVNSFIATGSLGNVITLTTASGTATLVKAGGTVTGNYCTVSNLIGSPASTWYMTNSTDGGGNTNINFI